MLLFFIGIQVLRAVVIESSVFCGGTCLRHLQGRRRWRLNVPPKRRLTFNRIQALYPRRWNVLLSYSNHTILVLLMLYLNVNLNLSRDYMYIANLSVGVFIVMFCRFG
jgi:hypothetical protein